MDRTAVPFSLVERKQYDEVTPQPIAEGIWWVGFVDGATGISYNPFLLVDHDEAVLINPGSCAKEHHQTVSQKVTSLVAPEQIGHIVVHHHDPDRCAAIPLFEKLAGRQVRIYAPNEVATSIAHYGCTGPIIGLDGGDSIILKSGRTLDYVATPHLPFAGSGFLYDPLTRTIFSGAILGCIPGPWNLFAAPNAWETLGPCAPNVWDSKKALLYALNKIERLGPERICPHHGPIIDENIDQYIAMARRLGPEK